MKIDLDKRNGTITVGDLKLTPEFSLANLEIVKERYGIIFVSNTNTGYTFYRTSFLDDGEIGALFGFKNGKIGRLHFGTGINYNFPAYVITEGQKELVWNLVKSVGGERKYSWGYVFYSIDYKGGSVTMQVTYD